MAAELPVESPPLVPDTAALSAALERTNCVLATVLEVSPTALRVVDVTGRIVRINDRALAEHAAPQPVTLRELWERDRPCRAHDEAPLGFLETPGMRALGGHATHRERLTVHRLASVEPRVVEFSASPVLGNDGTVLGAVISERHLGAGASRWQDLEPMATSAAVAVLQRQPSNEPPDGATGSASGPIHDVNNALNTIMAAAFLVQHNADSPDAMHDYAGRIQAAAEAAAFAAAQLERIVRRASISTDASPDRDRAMPVTTPATMSEKAGPSGILLVEDNDAGREVISRLLRAAGHRVDAVATCAEAREKLGSTVADAPDVLLTDLELPDGNGWELAAYARMHRPSVRIGVISGWDASSGSEDAVSADFVLCKPLDTAALLDHIAGRKAPALPES